MLHNRHLENKPDFHKIKEWFEQEVDYIEGSPESYARGFRNTNSSADAVYGKLARGEEVSEFDGGGDILEVVEEVLL